MTEIAPSINLNLSEKLKDPEYRRQFFLAESSALIASQIIALRKRRSLNQKELAERAHMKQPAISRVEQADYQNWSFNTLRRLAEAMDARLRVLIEPSEDVLAEYEDGTAEKEVPSEKEVEFEVVWKRLIESTITAPPPENKASAETKNSAATATAERKQSEESKLIKDLEKFDRSRKREPDPFKPQQSSAAGAI